MRKNTKRTKKKNWEKNRRKLRKPQMKERC